MEALYEMNGEQFVYLESGEKPRDEIGREHKVKTGLSDGKMVEILEDLQAGDRVVYRQNIPNWNIMGLPASFPGRRGIF